MPHVCPKSCGRLATAAILIAVGVVQLIAGLVLIKSKYVYLLSAPDLWTAVSNFSVGGLLGVSASVWKEIGKMSSKHATRRNILASLMFSCLLINATTAAIMILGEGNALLSIQLEDSGIHSPSAVNSEILAYAYATSVCSPIICVVISCVYMSGICFRRKTRRKENSKTRKTLDEDDPLAYNWVFKSKVGNKPKPDPEIIRRALSTKYLSSSTDDDSYCSSDSYHPYRSNSVPSVEGMEESLQTAIGRSRARSESNLFPSQSDRQERILGTEDNTLPRRSENTVSNIDESSRGVIPSKEVLLSLPRNFNRHFEKERNHSHLADRRINAVDMPKREKQMVVENSNGRIESDIPFNHSDLEKIEIQSNRSRHRVPLKQQFPKLTQIPRPSLVTADVHFDSKPLKSSHGYTNHSYSPEDSTLIYEDARFSGDIRKENDCFPDRKVCRTSTTKSHMLGEMGETRNYHTSVRRTNKPLMPHSQEECSIIEDWNYDGNRDKEKPLTRGSTLPKQYSKKASLSTLRKQAEEIEKGLSARVADDTFDSSQIDCLAGEVVPIQVSTLPKKLSSKLVPVNIPAVGSSVRRYSLKGAEKSLSRNMQENKRRGTSLVKASKFDGHGEPKLLSFRGGMKAKDYRNRNTKNSVPLSNQHIPTSKTEPSTPNYTEYPTRRSCPTSPAHTSGYMSALEETLEPSERGDETLVLSSSSVQMNQERHSSKSPSQKTVCIEYNFGDSSGMVKETMTRIIEESPELKSKKELIDQLLRDPAFQKMVKQTLKETEI